MLFNSYAFLLVFLPVALLGRVLLERLDSRRAIVIWLIACSIAFYGVWNPLSLAIIAPSLLVNYLLALRLRRCVVLDDPASQRWASVLLAVGIAFNVCFLGYFKYRNFFVESANVLLGTQGLLIEVLLPLGISFITFQKIAFLVDIRVGSIERFDAIDFLIFVFFFPQLIAGPIVHYREMVPQFKALSIRLRAEDLAVGFGLFAIGLFKKAVLADGIAPHATALFDGVWAGNTVDFLAAWIGAVAYMLQIYFDFSGYSDMAIGLARLFGIRLPANFNSPLKSSSFIEFWSRWHMTLTRFLTAYVYSPLVMRLTRRRMQRGQPVLDRRHKGVAAFAALLAGPTLLTMFISGFWHGAGTTFILWGLMHGVLLCINHAWRLWHPAWDKLAYDRVMKPLGLVITLLALILTMVLFRARDMATAMHILHAMIGLDGFALPQAVFSRMGGLGQWLGSHGLVATMSSGVAFVQAVAWLLGLGVVALGLPNSLELMRSFEPALGFKANARQRGWAVAWQPGWAVTLSTLMLVGVMSLNRISEFLYWQF